MDRAAQALDYPRGSDDSRTGNTTPRAQEGFVPSTDEGVLLRKVRSDHAVAENAANSCTSLRGFSQYGFLHSRFASHYSAHYAETQDRQGAARGERQPVPRPVYSMSVSRLSFSGNCPRLVIPMDLRVTADRQVICGKASRTPPDPGPRGPVFKICVLQA